MSGHRPAKTRLFLLPLLALVLFFNACTAQTISARVKVTQSPPPAAVTPAPAAAVPESTVPEFEESCAACELPEVEPLPEGYDLLAQAGNCPAYPRPETTDTAADDEEELNLLCPPCGLGGSSEPDEPGVYRTLTYQQAKEIMDADEDVIVVDVRTKEEYAAGHIPGALLIPNETIAGEMPALLPDTSATILIYCRSGNRSMQASVKLLEMGYEYIYDFGGINGWPYDIVTGNNS